MQQQQTISLLDCEVRQKVDFIQQLLMTSSVVGLRRSSKALPKAKLAPKKTVTVTAWWSAACLIHCSFLNPGKTITSEKCAQPVDEMHQKLRCLQPALVNRKGRVLHLPVPSCTLHSQCFQSCTNWAAKFCLICHIHLTSRQLITSSSSISTTFCRDNASITSRTQKLLSKSLLNPKAQIFMLQE